MSQCEFTSALSRISYTAGLLAAQGNQQEALGEMEALAARLDHRLALATPLPFSPALTQTAFSPATSPLALGPSCVPPWDGSIFSDYYAQTPAPFVQPVKPRLAPQPNAFAFDTPLTFANPPPPPNAHDMRRKDRPMLHVLPKGAPDVPASMYPRRCAPRRTPADASKPGAPDAG